MNPAPDALAEIKRKLAEARTELEAPRFLYTITRRTLRKRIERLETELHDLTDRPGKKLQL